MKNSLVIGIDGGGTNTRVSIANLQGHIVGYGLGGSSHPLKDSNAGANVKWAVEQALQKAGGSIQQVIRVVAGLAGLYATQDLQWTQPFTSFFPATTRYTYITDAQIAQIGAFTGKPGIVAIAGTGSVIGGLTEKNVWVRNRDFQDDCLAAARYLSYAAVHRILAGEAEKSDEQFMSKLLVYWDCGSLEDLREKAKKGFIVDQMKRDRYFADMAPLVTQAALDGSGVAQSVCQEKIQGLIRSIRLVGSTFSSAEIPVSFNGGVIQSFYMSTSLQTNLEKLNSPRFRITQPLLAPSVGAILQAYQEENIAFSPEILTQLQHSAQP